MIELHILDQDTDQLYFYEIRVEGHLDNFWAETFTGLDITLEENGVTVLTGPVVDQASLWGLLRKVRDLGLPLLSVNRLYLDRKHGFDKKSKKYCK